LARRMKVPCSTAACEWVPAQAQPRRARPARPARGPHAQQLQRGARNREPLPGPCPSPQH
jgi:hypothetical protein